MTTRRNSTILAAALALALASATASAQSPVAAISGQALPTDTVIIQNLDTGFTKEVTPKANGRYQLRNLPPGSFSVVVKHADGTLEPARVISVRVGQTARVQ